MEKFGVKIADQIETGDGVKTAASVSHCPKCGAKLGASYPATRSVPKSTLVDFESKGVPWCPNCGTEPFEEHP